MSQAGNSTPHRLADLDTVHGKFLHACIRHGLDNSAFCNDEAAHALLDELAETELGCFSTEAVSPRYRNALLSFFSSFPLLSMIWVDFSGNRFLESNTKCPVCASRAISYEVVFEEFESRLLVACPRCVEVVDIPLGSMMPTLSISSAEAGLISLGPLPEGASAVLNILTRQVSERFSIPWPTDEAGKLLANLTLPVDSLPAGPLVCRILYAWGMEVGAISFKLRKVGGAIYTPAHPHPLQLSALGNFIGS
ncbi:MAG: hypothetical protein ABIP67_09185 [Burkholderiales bacterium]